MRPPRLCRVLRTSFGVALLLLTACADRTVITDTGDSSDTEDTDPAQGEALSSCLDEDDCFVQWCVHPAGESGFCTFACSDTDSCPAGSSGTATATCLLVGADEVCALDCGSGRSCPSNMRCEQIESGGQARAICF